MGRSSVFSLEQVYRKQLTKNWTDIFDPFIYVTSVNPATSAGPAYGYFAGGNTVSGSYNHTTVDRIDFSNDTATASAKGNMTYGRGNGGGAGNTTHGYIFGGAAWSGTAYSYISRVQYSNDTATVSSVSNLSLRNYWYGHAASVGTVDFGYTGGTDNGGPPAYTGGNSILDRLDYANDTATALERGSGIFNPIGYGYGTTGNSTHGYFGGGYHGTIGTLSSIRRLDYANDTAALASKGPLSGSARYKGATGNANYGYYNTGAAGSGSNGSGIDRLDYSSDTTTASPKGPLSNSTTTNTAATGDASYGYFGGRSSGSPINNWYSNVDRIDYANDTATASPKGPLSESRFMIMAFSGQENGITGSPKSVTPAMVGNPVGPAHGYFAGGAGYPGTGESLVQRIDFASDTSTASNKGNLPIVLKNAAGGSNSTHGYTFGGYYNYSQISNTYRVDYADDTAAATPKGKLSNSAQLVACVGTSRFGYVGGFNGPAGYYSRIDRFDYASDTSTSIADDIFDPGSYGTAAIGNLTHGYFAGGQNITPSATPSTQYYSVVRRVDYSNDTATTSPKGPLSSGHVYNGATGNLNFGYINIYDPYTYAPLGQSTVITRIEYANDTATSSPKGNLVYQAGYNNATGSKDYGYWGGGFFQSYSYPNEYKSTIDRLDFANDTATAVTKGPLSTTGERHASFGGQQNQFGDAGTPVDKGAEGTFTTQIFPLGPAYGYWGTGNPGNGPGPTTLSLIQRLDYSNDSANALVRSTLASPEGNRRSTAAVASKTHAYWTGGTPGPFSYVDRLDFSNDSATAVRKGPLTAANYLAAGTGNESYGYLMGGRPNYQRSSRLDRIDYANDGVAAVSKGPLSATFAYGAATGNADYGYAGGGYIYPAPNPASSSLDRVDYANDTTAATPKGNLSEGRYNFSATGNADYGWFAGGNLPSPVGKTSIIDRVDYANDTSTAVAKGPLGNGRVRTGATGSSSFGYWSGGFVSTKIERVDYANDTGTASQRGNLAAFAPAYTGYMDFTAAASGQANGMIARTVITYIPRVRFIDLAEEGSSEGGGEGGGGESPTPSPPTGPAYGYQTGGDGYPGTGSRIERIDYSNDTATTSQRGYLNNGGRNIVRHGATGNLTHGYTFGGSGYTNISKVDYANDTAAAPTTAYLAHPADYCSSVGNNDYGWTGGRPWSYPYYLGRFDYANDTQNDVQRGPSSAFYPGPGYYGYSATGNQNYGYFAGGSGSTYVRRVDYANDDQQVSIKGPLSSTAPYSCATGNADYGWVLVGPSWSSQSGINRIDFANDTATASVRGSLSGSAGYRGSVGSNDYGYFCGGYSSYTFVHRVDFASDTGTQSTKGPLSVAMYRQAGFSAQQYGASSSPAPAPEPSPGPTPSGNTVTAPFQPPFPFPVQLYNKRRHGYFAGGYSTVPSSTVLSQTQRIDFTNDTATAVLKGNLTIPGPMQSDSQSGTGSPNHGYIAGGNPASTNADRIDYANDTATATLKSNVLTVAASRLAAVGNASYGYFAGGAPGTKTQVSRLDYSNDGGGGVSKGNLSTSGTGKTGVGNQSYGYVSGGIFKTTVDRIDYANDTATATPKGPLAAQGYARGAAGNTSFGYFAGGSPETVSGTNIQRIDYANDSNTALLKGTISESKYYLAGTGDQSYGYFGGGREAGDPSQTDIPSTSKIERIDFANDTATASPKGPLAIAFRQGAAVSAAANANP